MTNHDPANRRRRDESNSGTGKLLRKRTSKRFRLLRELQHQPALQVDSAVQTARELEVTFQQRARVFELIYYRFRGQILTSKLFGVIQSKPECRLIQI